MHWNWISCQKCLKLQMGVAGPFFEPQPSNLVRIHFFLSCKDAEIFAVIFQLVSNLAKICVSVPSISWGVLDLVYPWHFFKEDYVMERKITSMSVSINLVHLFVVCQITNKISSIYKIWLNFSRCPKICREWTPEELLYYAVFTSL